jgi:hypothetical protein
VRGRRRARHSRGGRRSCICQRLQRRWREAGVPVPHRRRRTDIAPHASSSDLPAKLPEPEFRLSSRPLVQEPFSTDVLNKLAADSAAAMVMSMNQTAADSIGLALKVTQASVAESFAKYPRILEDLTKAVGTQRFAAITGDYSKLAASRILDRILPEAIDQLRAHAAQAVEDAPQDLREAAGELLDSMDDVRTSVQQGSVTPSPNPRESNGCDRVDGSCAGLPRQSGEDPRERLRGHGAYWCRHGQGLGVRLGRDGHRRGKSDREPRRQVVSPRSGWRPSPLPAPPSRG